MYHIVYQTVSYIHLKMMTNCDPTTITNILKMPVHYVRKNEKKTLRTKASVKSTSESITVFVQQFDEKVAEFKKVILVKNI